VTPNGGAAVGPSCRAPKEGGKTCFGTPGSRLVSTLDEDGAQVACKNYHESTRITPTAEFACHQYAEYSIPYRDTDANVDAGVEPPLLPDATVRATCAEAYEACMANPDIRQEYQSYDDEWSSRAYCGDVPSGCNVTFDELAECADAVTNARANDFRQCDELRADLQYPQQEQPEVCALLPDDCYWFLINYP
jgi:hypothetical protein